jgi:hypothetical protein
MAVWVAALAISTAAHAIDTPDGWTRTVSGSVETFTPRDLAANERFTIAVYPATQTRGQPLDRWLNAWASDKAPGAAASGLRSTLAADGRSATGQVVVKDERGTPLLAMFIAVSLNQDRVRAMRILASSDAELFAKVKPVLAAFIEQLANEEAAAYVAEKPSVAGNTGGSYVDNQRAESQAAVAASGVPRGSRLGGPFKYGTYEFEFPLPAINQVRRYKISFYENGEWRKEERGDDETSKFTYDARTGAANISVLLNLYNSSYDEEDFCRFYVAPDGRAYIYAEDEYGLGVHRITGRYVGPNTRPSPSAESQAKAAAEAEAERFKWITAPGRGVPREQIAGVLYQLEQIYGIGGLELRETSYLLLRDGSAYEDLRCPPDQLDVLTSRKREPLQWGRWRKSGNKYELQMPDQDGKLGAWKAPSMATLASPANKGERLQGRFQKASSFQIPGGAGSVSYRGITFTRAGRFETDFFNFVAGSTGFGDDRVTTGAMADDEGSSSSVSGPNFGGGTSTRSNRPKAERSGTYEIDGYTLLLRFDDGKIERLPFFFAYDGRDSIWFRGAVYAVPTK